MGLFCDPPRLGGDARLATPKLRRELVGGCELLADAPELAAFGPEMARAGELEAAVAARHCVGPLSPRRRFDRPRSEDIEVQLLLWAQLADPLLPDGVAANFHVNALDALAVKPGSGHLQQAPDSRNDPHFVWAVRVPGPEGARGRQATDPGVGGGFNSQLRAATRLKGQEFEFAVSEVGPHRCLDERASDELLVGDRLACKYRC